MSFGAFSAGDFHFQVDEGFAVLELPEVLHELAIEDLDARLLQHDLPGLQGAPLASWLLARLEALTEGRGLGFRPGLVEHIEGGVWVVDFVVHHRERPAGKVQLQGGMIGAGLLGVLAEHESPEAVLSALVARLVDAPGEVAVCEVRIVDPEWETSPEDYAPAPDSTSVARFGFDGARYLGADNVAPKA